MSKTKKRSKTKTPQRKSTRTRKRSVKGEWYDKHISEVNSRSMDKNTITCNRYNTLEETEIVDATKAHSFTSVDRSVQLESPPAPEHVTFSVTVEQGETNSTNSTISPSASGHAVKDDEYLTAGSHPAPEPVSVSVTVEQGETTQTISPPASGCCAVEEGEEVRVGSPPVPEHDSVRKVVEEGETTALASKDAVKERNSCDNVGNSSAEMEVCWLAGSKPVNIQDESIITNTPYLQNLTTPIHTGKDLLVSHISSTPSIRKETSLSLRKSSMREPLNLKHEMELATSFSGNPYTFP